MDKSEPHDLDLAAATIGVEVDFHELGLARLVRSVTVKEKTGKVLHIGKDNEDLVGVYRRMKVF